MIIDRSVAEVMTRNPLTLSPAMSLKQMDELFVKHSVSGAPVLEKDKLVGVASRADALRHLLEDQSEASLVSGFYASPFPLALSVLSQLSADSRDIVRRMAGRHVRDVMSPDVVTIQASDRIQLAAQKMASGNIHRLPVIDGDRLVGIVSALDIVRALAAES